MKNTRKNTIRIGNFKPDKKGIFHGRLFGIGLDSTPVVFLPQVSKDGKDYFRLVADHGEQSYDIGAGFRREKDGVTYYSVSMDSPALPAPINAGLFKDREGNGYNLVWSRQEYDKELKAEATVNVNVQPQPEMQGVNRPANPTLAL